MEMMRSRLVWLLACSALAFVLPAMAQTPAFPDKSIRLIVGFPPGGATDVIARVLAQGLTIELGQTVLVENKGGASGIIGSELVVKSPPDGYTLLFAPSSHATLPALYPTLSFDPIRDFTPIATVARTPYILVVYPGLEVKTVAELLAVARAKPNSLAYASTGMGTAQHLAGEVLQRTAKVEILHVPYKGSGAVRADLLAGRIQTMFDNVAVMLPYVQRGEMRGLAVTGPKRSALVPELPTLRELGLEAAEIEGWFILLGPAGVPEAVAQRLNAAVNKVLASPGMAERLATMGAEPLIGPPQDVVTLVNGDRDRWGKVIRDGNIKPE
jgi:tripartite-type tricarboxylate transporter receptor subunit TctC